MTTELAQLQLLSQVDDLVARLSVWSDEPSAWEPVQRGKALVRRLLQRLEPMRARVEAPLVVATFGGTGVGKSSLVNALVGEEVTAAGRQRPTTTQPVVLAHPQTNLAVFGLPLSPLAPALRGEGPGVRGSWKGKTSVRLSLMACPRRLAGGEAADYSGRH